MSERSSLDGQPRPRLTSEEKGILQAKQNELKALFLTVTGREVHKYLASLFTPTDTLASWDERIDCLRAARERVHNLLNATYDWDATNHVIVAFEQKTGKASDEDSHPFFERVVIKPEDGSVWYQAGTQQGTDPFVVGHEMAMDNEVLASFAAAHRKE